VEIPVGTPQTRVVLALLVLHANEVVSIGRMSDELWGGSPPCSAKPQIHGIISRSRRLLGRERIATARPGYLLRANAAELELDVVRDDVARARRLLATGAVEPGAARLRSALARWRGPALEELRCASHVADGLDEFRLTVLEDRVDADLLLGRSADLVCELVQLVAEHPLRERLRAQLMTALATSGRPADALRAYTAYRKTMVEELGVEPSTELRGLHTRILRGEPPAAGRTPGRGRTVSRPART
jgi:DNA-binding SARP family transcriptional activator